MMMIPGTVTLIPVYLLLVELGRVNTYQELIAPLIAGPFGIFLLRQHFKSLPTALGDAAKIDGCNNRTSNSCYAASTRQVVAPV